MKHFLRILLLVTVALTSANAKAQCRVYINDFAISPGQTLEVPIYLDLDKDDFYVGLQGDVIMPDGLTLAPYANENYFRKTQRGGWISWIGILVGATTNKFRLVGMSMGTTITPATGVIAYCQVQAAEDFTGEAQINFAAWYTGDSGSGNYVISSHPCTVTSTATAVSALHIENAIATQRFFNIAGVEMNEAAQGVNIVVTTYTDGTTSTAKVLK